MPSLHEACEKELLAAAHERRRGEWLGKSCEAKIPIRASGSHLSMVKTQQTFQSSATGDWPVARAVVEVFKREWNDVADFLMGPLGVIMIDVFGDRMAWRRFSKDDHPIEAFGLDRQHEPLREGIQIRTSRWQLESVDADDLENHVESSRDSSAPVDHDKLRMGVPRMTNRGSDVGKGSRSSPVQKSALGEVRGNIDAAAHGRKLKLRQSFSEPWPSSNPAGIQLQVLLIQ